MPSRIRSKASRLKTARAALAAATSKPKREIIHSDTVWLVEPIGDHTNETLSDIPGTSEEGLIECSDGRKHFLWRMPDHSSITALNKSQDKNLAYRVYRRRGKGIAEAMSDLFRRSPAVS